jgi:hypothetical protein
VRKLKRRVSRRRNYGGCFDFLFFFIDVCFKMKYDQINKICCVCGKMCVQAACRAEGGTKKASMSVKVKTPVGFS